ncbi:uncharacterized protein LOC103312521 [Tribolium castaneum]|uniref:Pupal cuticle protein Edg-84A-like Protein n=1 Tax=Tribolium castaneum TaxID=7070 RepID=D2A1R8_TRICA|nr:PREDICTED: uncharacterized protein LOC103312521 [Tribolium castaneum]EFA02118.1 hypothetical protein TcasGA2_TC007764 [Tribolium castaneum]|eukprot:XP_008191564.1 PREDICTED: uncharacterized protein LOC103312521 [Tribolium castaneum]
MKFLIVLTVIYTTAHGGIITHDHERAHSYQNIHMEHFHAVPTYIKKEHSHLLQHPISIGTSSSKVEVHHGDKHDHGYAFANAENNIHGHAAFQDFGLTDGHDAVGTYQVHDLEHFSGLGDSGHVPESDR